jgi:endoglucanase
MQEWPSGLNRAVGRALLISALLLPSSLGCAQSLRAHNQVHHGQTHNGAIQTVATASLPTPELLQQSWQAYRDRFIQGDGRIIDREAGDRSTSEGQAYALLRAVLADDPEVFERVLHWSEDNLQRRELDGRRKDSLWAWQWGRDAEGHWVPLDANFASDGDIDAITALILASRRWDRPDYLDLARVKLRDLWRLAVVPATQGSKTTYYFLPGPREAFHPRPDRVYINPSYLAPYAFRLFAQVDPERDWHGVIDSSYELLEDMTQLSSLSLPSNWILVDTTTGKISPSDSSAPLHSLYGFDAYRVWWRVSLDASWFNESRARDYLDRHLDPLAAMWRSQQSIPAQLSLQGQPLATYESTAQYAMLYAAFHITDPEIAEQIRQQKLIPAYRNGFWDNDSAYYIQNLGWLGLFPPTEVATHWLRP